MIWRGIAIGIIISAPMGPVGILCVQRTLEKGRRTGFFTGIGAAISDMFYCILTGFGLSFIEDFLTRNHNILQLFGSVVLIAFGIYLFKSNPSRNLRKPEEGISDRRNILNGFLFTFSNPLIIFLIIGLFARFNFLVPEIQAYHYVIGFISIGAGALLWWWVVTFFVAKLRTHFNLRSMWLINKIIGGIILIFAVVGIVTSVSAMASAKSRAPDDTNSTLYLNSSRGFGSFTDSDTIHLRIEAEKGDTVNRSISLAGHKTFSLSCRAANLHNAPAKSYPAGNGKKIKHPAWGIEIKNKNGVREFIEFRTEDNHRDETYSSPAVHISSSSGAGTKVSKDIDCFDGVNSFFLSFDKGQISLSAGNREYKPIMSWESGLTCPDSIGFSVTPGALLEIDDIVLSFPETIEGIEKSEFGNPDILRSHILRSSDKHEGVWEVFDRSLDEESLKLGGDYTFALIASEEGYLLIYLDGAKIERSAWEPGMIKARLVKTGFKDVYNVRWIDAVGKRLENEVKAQYEAPLLTFYFPEENSTLRLRKTGSRSFAPTGEHQQSATAQ